MAHRRTRREFMGLTAATVAAAAGGVSPAAAQGAAGQGQGGAADAGAELIVFNAKVYTVDGRLPKAEALAVTSGRFLAVGSTADIRGLAGKGTQSIDAKQMTIVPGFTDCHNHAGGDVLLYEVLVGNPFEVEFVTIASIIEKLRAKAAQTPAGTWVEGFFFDDTNGDVAIDMFLTAVERAQRLFPRADTRPKITHCTLVTDDLLRRIKAIGAVPAMFTTYAYYNTDKFVFYGEELMKRSMAYRSMLDAGIPAATGSDFSPGPFAPLMGIQGMVTRTGWNGETWGASQRISVDEALRVNTINGAYASHEEAIKGSIVPGKLADFVVLADDPHTVEPQKIKDIAIARTVVGGTTVYEA